MFCAPFNRESHPNIAVLFTDGTPTDYTAMDDELEQLRNITILPIGISMTTITRLNTELSVHLTTTEEAELAELFADRYPFNHIIGGYSLTT